MKVYSPSEVARQLDIKESTLRKYSILLEKAGVTFNRNSQNQRWYSDNDVIMLRKFITFKNNGDMSLKECAEAVYSWTKGNDVAHPQTDSQNDTQRYDSDILELKEVIHKQTEVIHALSDRLDQQSEYLKQLDQRTHERDQKLMQVLNEQLETRKLIAASEEKKSLWKRLFTKNK